MASNSLFSFLLPKENKFFPMLNDVGDVLVNASELLVKLIKTEDQTKREELYRLIKSYETQGDVLTDKIFVELNNSFITPFDREDIHSLCDALDDTIDSINSSSKRIILFKPKDIPECMVEICRIIFYSAKSVRIILGVLNTACKSPKVALEQCNLLHDYEQTGDELYEEFIKTNFTNASDDILELVKKKEIMQELEGATDFAKKIGTIIKTIIVKYA